MKLISWNVNGLRACMGKGFAETFAALDADFFSLQETKMQPGQLELELPGYQQFWYSAEKKGYSGTAVFTRHPPLSVSYGVGVERTFPYHSPRIGRIEVVRHGVVRRAKLYYLRERSGKAAKIRERIVTK